MNQDQCHNNTEEKNGSIFDALEHGFKQVTNHEGNKTGTAEKPTKERHWEKDGEDDLQSIMMVQEVVRIDDNQKNNQEKVIIQNNQQDDHDTDDHATDDHDTDDQDTDDHNIYDHDTDDNDDHDKDHDKDNQDTDDYKHDYDTDDDEHNDDIDDNDTDDNQEFSSTTTVTCTAPEKATKAKGSTKDKSRKRAEIVKNKDQPNEQAEYSSKTRAVSTSLDEIKIAPQSTNQDQTTQSLKMKKKNTCFCVLWNVGEGLNNLIVTMQIEFVNQGLEKVSHLIKIFSCVYMEIK